jgi:hypothetical protein
MLIKSEMLRPWEMKLESIELDMNGRSAILGGFGRAFSRSANS